MTSYQVSFDILFMYNSKTIAETESTLTVNYTQSANSSHRQKQTQM